MKPCLLMLMQESNSIIDLEQRLNDFGMRFDSIRDYLAFLDTEWEIISEPKVKKAIDSPVSDEPELPTLTVNFDEVSFLLHGINHGFAEGDVPKWHLRNNVKEFIRQKALALHNPDEGEECFYEEDFANHFNLFNSMELTDTSSTSQPLPSFMSPKITSAMSSLARIRYKVYGLGCYLYFKRIKLPKTISQADIYFGQKSLTDPRFQAKYAEFILMQEMPQPFKLERDYLLEKGSFDNLMLGLATDTLGLATCSERSLASANQLLERSEFDGFYRIHYLAGLDHITQIAYFLQSPGYSFDRLEEYRLARR